jgi:hypothetical protein
LNPPQESRGLHASGIERDRKLETTFVANRAGRGCAIALIVLVVNPERAALSFLFDPIILDVAILFFGTQMLLFNGQLRPLLGGMGSNILQRFKRSSLKG